MFSIQGRLKLLFVVIVTTVLSISGTYAQLSLGKDLESSYRRLCEGVLTRLQISLPAALWDLDKAKVDTILDAEMLPPEVVSIRVYDSAVGLFSGKTRGDQGDLIPPGAPVQAELVFREGGSSGTSMRPVSVGKVVVHFSRAQIDAALASELTRKVVEVIVLDIILVLALSSSLRVVFRPLRQLRDGLFELAARGAEVEELPEDRKDELGDVIRGFNQIQRRLKSTIERTRNAEEAARLSARQTEQALEDLRQTQESLLQAERLASLGSLVAGVAHEINTPIGIALTSASVLKGATDELQAAVAADGVKKSTVMRYLETAAESSRLIMNNAYRAAHLIHSFKQIAVDQTSEARRPFALMAYVEEIVTSLRPKLKGIDIILYQDQDQDQDRAPDQSSANAPDNALAGAPADIVLDSYPGAFAQVLTNLLLNCAEHAFAPEQGGRIEVRARLRGDTVEMEVADNGSGIPPEIIDRVFDPFFTTRRGQGGTGLGLNIVYNLIVKQFNGVITARSTVGQGTEFLLRIPRVTPQADTGGAPTQEGSVPAIQAVQ